MSFLERKVTQGFLEMHLQRMTDAFLILEGKPPKETPVMSKSAAHTQLRDSSAVFALLNIPIKFIHDKYKIVDKSVVNRFIPREHEDWYNRLNEINEVMFHKPFIEQEELKRERTQLLTLLEKEKYDIVMLYGKYELKGITHGLFD